MVLEVVVDGQPRKVRAKVDFAIDGAVSRAAELAGVDSTVRELRDEAGARLDRRRSVRDLGIQSGARVFLARPAGVDA